MAIETSVAEARLGFRLIDSDNHYYEPHDCFTRYLDPEFAERSINVRVDDKGRNFSGAPRVPSSRGLLAGVMRKRVAELFSADGRECMRERLKAKSQLCRKLDRTTPDAGTEK